MYTWCFYRWSPWLVDVMIWDIVPIGSVETEIVLHISKHIFSSLEVDLISTSLSCLWHNSRLSLIILFLVLVLRRRDSFYKVYFTSLVSPEFYSKMWYSVKLCDTIPTPWVTNSSKALRSQSNWRLCEDFYRLYYK